MSTEDINALLTQTNTTVRVYTYSLLGESSNTSLVLDEHSVNRLQRMAQTTNGKYEVSFV